jgi:tetratricopeptide (TPR) repeat protein
VLLLVNFRPEYQAPWTSKTYYRHLRIDPLSSESAEELLQTLLGPDPSVVPLRPLLIARTEGNPLYLEESVRSMVETGELEGEPGAYRLKTALASIRVPATVQAILAARIDRLSPDHKHLLQAAAVIGKNVPYTVLHAVVDVSEATLRDQLAMLQAAEFVYEASLFPDLEYSFKHALTHEVAYSSVLLERRKALHLRIMEAIERIYNGRILEQIELLAHHAARAEVWPKVLEYSSRALDKAVGRSANREAWSHLEQAIAALPHLPQSRANLERAVDLRLFARICVIPLGEFKRVLELAREALPLSEALGNVRRQVLVHATAALALSILGNIAEGRQHGERALAIAEQLNDPLLRIAARYARGLPEWNSGALRTALQYFERDVGLEREQIGAQLLDPHSAEPITLAFARNAYCMSLHGISNCLAWMGDFNEAQLQAERAVEYAQRLNILAIRAFADSYLGGTITLKGDLRTAVPMAERWLEDYGAADLANNQVVMVIMLGSALIESNRSEEATALFERAWRFAESKALLGYHPQLLRPLCEAHWRNGRFEEAVATGERGIVLSRAVGARVDEARLLHLLGNVYASSSSPDYHPKAEDYHEQALALAGELRLRPLQAQCHFALGKLAVQMAQKGAARERLHLAKSMFENMGMQSWLDRTRAKLRELDA